MRRNIENIRHLCIKDAETVDIIAKNTELLLKSGDFPLLAQAGRDFLEGRRVATNYHTATLLLKLYRL